MHRATSDATRHPLAEPTYRALWSANLIANIGVWMQTVSGAWLMTTLTSDALPVALMQTATTIPAFLVGLPAGSLADRVDRRWLLLVTNAAMFISVALMAAFTLLGWINPWLLLALTFALGVGATINSPTWAALLPEVVSRAQMPMAIIMNSAGYNVARAIGPTIGGFVVIASGPAATFLLNALSFVLTFGVVFRWRPRVHRDQSPLRAETFVRTIVTGLQYAWQARPQRIVLARSSIFMLCASALWGLLPLVAKRELALEANGYGLLVSCVGAGAVAGSFALARLRRHLPMNTLLIAAVVMCAGMLLTLAWVRWLPAVCVMLGLGGAAWTSSNQNFHIAIQMSAPGWVRARAIAAYLLTFQGGLAVGSALWGLVAEHAGDVVALTLAAAGLGVGLIAAFRWPVEDQK